MPAQSPPAADPAALAASQDDSVARAMDILGERWTLLILRQAFFGVHRFGQMQRNLGISRNILTTRLRLLVDNGVIKRRRYRRAPDRYEYQLTQKGLDLFPAVVAIMRWGDIHLSGKAGPPLYLRHAKCGKRTIPQLVCSKCGEEIEAQDFVPEPGPGFNGAP
jgi:DNA-binding HxlR family transcriptional regulator